MKMMKKWHKTLGIVSLLAILTVLLVPIPHGLDAEDESGMTPMAATGGDITLEKWREDYTLIPGQETTIHLKAEADPVTDKSPVNVILTLDMSGSMVNNGNLTPTLTAARKAAKTIIDDNPNSKVALVRYDTAASVYRFDTGQWVLLDANAAAINSLSAGACYSSNLSQINGGLEYNTIVSVNGVDGDRFYTCNNYPRQNGFTFYFTTGQDLDYLAATSNSAYDPVINYGSSSSYDLSRASAVARSQVGATNLEAGAIVTQLVSEKLGANNAVYPIFMTDGVPTAFQFSGNISVSTNTLVRFKPYYYDGYDYVGQSWLWDSRDNNAKMLPQSTDQSRVQARNASAALRGSSSIKQIYAVGVNNWGSQYNHLKSGLDDAQSEILAALTGTTAGDNKNSFITADPSANIENIYDQIANEIIATPITSAVTISDVVPAEFDLTSQQAELLAQARAIDSKATVEIKDAGNGKKEIVWTFPGGLLPSEPIEVTYKLKAKYGNYGIADTNESASLSYDEFCPKESTIGNADDPNGSRPDGETLTLPFPVPQVKIQPAGGQNDRYEVPSNNGTFTLSDASVINKNVAAITPKTGNIATENLVTGNDNDGNKLNKVDDGPPYNDVPSKDQNVQPLKIVLENKSDAIGNLTIRYPDASDLTNVDFDYQPNSTHNPTTGYTETYRYRYQSTDSDTDPAYKSEWYTITIDVPAAKNKAAIEFKKVGDGGTPLGGAKFELLSENDNWAVIAQVTTTPDGIGRFDDLEAGAYMIREVEAPTDYILNANYYNVEITPSQQSSGVTVKLGEDITNELAKGSITLKKIDEKGQPLDGAKFDLYASSDTKHEHSLGQVTSGTDGIVTFTNVKAGKYVVVETSPPPGYSGGYVSEVIHLTTAGNKLAIDIGNVTNVHDEFDLVITKKGEGDLPLQGATFELFLEGNGSKGQVTSDNSGIISFTNLAYGTYILKEIQAPTGYSLLTAEYTIVVGKTNQSVTIDGDPVGFTWTTAEGNPKVSFAITNKKMPELPKTGGPGIAAFILIGGGLMTYGINGLKKPKYTKKGNRSEK